MKSHFSKYICCMVEITMAARLISFIGISISFILMTVLMNDKLNRSHDYEISRKTALALGLDWSHFHENTSTYPDDDPEGTMIQIIMVFYSLAFLVLNLILFFGSLKKIWVCAVPWLFCELLGCISKFGALIFHLRCEPSHTSRLFIVGSIIYIGLIIWLWLVIFSAMKIWRCTKAVELETELRTISFEKPIRRQK